jgi:hypothetical protein
MANNTELLIINRILIDSNRNLSDSNRNLSDRLDSINKRNESRDKINLEIIKKTFIHDIALGELGKLVQAESIDECKEVVRLLNTCNCCDRHNTNKIKPNDFDNYLGCPIVYNPSNRPHDELVIEWAKCDCHCRMMSRMIYRNYCEKCE